MQISGAVWALAAGVGFGVFQSLNRRAVKGMDVYLATFLQLLVSAVVLAVISALTVDLRVLSSAPLAAYVNFALAGFFHFFLGWTLLNLSQKLIGAARTSPLIGTNPLWAVLIAAATLREFPSWISLVGIVLIVAGVAVISAGQINAGAGGGPTGGSPGGAAPARLPLWRGAVFGLAAALCWAISPIFIRRGLAMLPSPVLGVTVGLAASCLAYGLPLLWRRSRQGTLAASTDALVFKVLAGILVGLSTWGRWVAIDLAPVAMVLALSLVSVPTVILLSPLVAGKHLEHVTAGLWAGATLVVIGALVLIPR